jgi:hypothetical protein
MPSESLSPREADDLLHKLITESTRVQGAFAETGCAIFVAPNTHPNKGGGNVVLTITCDALGVSVSR